jgi:putative Ca2+/H+ antiporter (TMEM165/GDT1 family)
MLVRDRTRSSGPEDGVNETFADEFSSFWRGSFWYLLERAEPERLSLMSSLLLLVTVFALTFVAELPDKSLFASLVLGTRYRPAHVWLGVAAAFAVHVALAVGAGGLLTLAPKSVTDFVTAGLFLGGAIWMLQSASEDENEPGPDAARLGAPAPSFLRVFATSFTVVFIGEWGDVTQITTANFVARYNDPLIIGVAALAALWAVSALAVFGGAKLLERVPVRWVRLVGAVALTGLGIYSLVRATGSLR